MSGKIASLTSFKERGMDGQSMQELTLLKDLGVEGDLHQGGDRQVSVFTVETRKWMETQEVKGLCFKRFKENILFEDLPLDTLQPGDLISLGDAVLRISTFIKPCFDECPLYSAGTPCHLSQCAKFAIVHQGGTVRVGDVASIFTE
jgi:cyclic pyranopterin phosphate synthase